MKSKMTSGVEQRSGGEFDRFDLVMIEREAREMRAEFFARAVRSAVRWIARRDSAAREAGASATRIA